jgi:hypothetical protein
MTLSVHSDMSVAGNAYEAMVFIESWQINLYLCGAF